MAYNTKPMLTDSKGRLIPQIYDPVTDDYLPLTTDVYSAVNVKNLPTVQDVNVTNQKATQTVDGTINVGNLPETQKVDVGNFPTSQKVEVTNQKAIQKVDGTVNVGNQPTDYPDGAALAELQSIKEDIAATKQTQAEILSRLDGTFNTQLTGSKTVLKGDPFPDGKQNNTLLEYDTASGETSIYKYISGDWRKL